MVCSNGWPPNPGVLGDAARQHLGQVAWRRAITATPFATAIEDLDNFKRSRLVGAWLGLTTRRCQSGKGSIDKRTHWGGTCHQEWMVRGSSQGLDCRVYPSWFSRPDLNDQPLRYLLDHESMPRGDPSR